jgi:hypothetical protein
VWMYSSIVVIPFWELWCDRVSARPLPAWAGPGDPCR